MIDFKKDIAESISKITNIDAKELYSYIEIPQNSEFGDYAFPCFKLAKELKKAPPVIANEIKEKIDLTGNLEKVEVVSRIFKFFYK